MVNLSGIVSRIFPSSKSWGSGSKSEGRAKSRAEYLKEKEERDQEAKDLKVVKEYYAEWLTAQCGLKVSATNLCQELANGVILCTLVEKIFDDVEPYDEYPVTWRDKAQNLSVFIKACKRLELPEDSILSVKDLKENAVIPVARCLFAIERRIEKKEKANRAAKRAAEKEKERREQELIEAAKAEQRDRKARLSKESLMSSASAKVDIDVGEEVVTKQTTTYDIHYDSDESMLSEGLLTSDGALSSDDGMSEGDAEEIIIERRSTRQGGKGRRKRSSVSSGGAEAQLKDDARYSSYDEEEKEDSIECKEEDVEEPDKERDEEELDSDSLSESEVSTKGDVEVEAGAQGDSPEDLFSPEEQREGNQEMFKILDEIFGSKSSDSLNLGGDSVLSDSISAKAANEEEDIEEAGIAENDVQTTTSQSRQAVKPPRFVGVRGTNFATPKPVFSGKRKEKPRKRVLEQPLKGANGDSDPYFRIAQSIQRKYQSDSAIDTSIDKEEDQLDAETVSSTDEILGLHTTVTAKSRVNSVNYSDSEDEREAESSDGSSMSPTEMAENAERRAAKDEDALSEGSEPEVEANPEAEVVVEESPEAQLVKEAKSSGDTKPGKKKNCKKKTRRTSKTSVNESKEAETQGVEVKEEEERENILLHGLVGLMVIAVIVACVGVVLELTGVTKYGLAESLGLVEPEQSGFNKILSTIIRI